MSLERDRDRDTQADKGGGGGGQSQRDRDPDRQTERRGAETETDREGRERVGGRDRQTDRYSKTLLLSFYLYYMNTYGAPYLKMSPKRFTVLTI